VLVITGYLNRLFVYVDKPVNYFTLNVIERVMSRHGFRYDRYKLFWWKDCKNIDEELQELEDDLREIGVKFKVVHPQYASLGDKYC